MADYEATYQINDVTMLPFSTEIIRDARVDFPEAGKQGQQTILRISGWLVGNKHAVHSVGLRCGGVLMAHSHVDLARPDIYKHFKGNRRAKNAGYLLEINTLMLPPEFELELVAFLDRSSIQIPFAKIRGKHRPIKPKFEPELQPIIILSPGRSGTTIMMRYLYFHPEVAADPVYPYEFTGTTYWLSLMRVLTADADIHKSSTPTSLLTDKHFIGRHPYNHFDYNPVLTRWFGSNYVDRVADFALESINECYKSLVPPDLSRPKARFYAEKFVAWDLYWLLNALYSNIRVLVLVRDPRDRYSSIEAFNTKRGIDGFGSKGFKSEMSRVHYENSILRFLHQELQNKPDQAHLVRYEDLMLDPENTLQGLFGHFGMSTDSELIKEIVARGNEDTVELSNHRTSADAHESIGRWKRDMPVELQRLYNTQLSETLQLFGYET